MYLRATEAEMNRVGNKSKRAAHWIVVACTEKLCEKKIKEIEDSRKKEQGKKRKKPADGAKSQEGGKNKKRKKPADGAKSQEGGENKNKTTAA